MMRGRRTLDPNTKLGGAVEALPEPLRAAVKLRLERGYPPSYIARSLGVTTEEAKALLAKAMRDVAKSAGLKLEPQSGE